MVESWRQIQPAAPGPTVAQNDIFGNLRQRLPRLRRLHVVSRACQHFDSRMGGAPVGQAGCHMSVLSRDRRPPRLQPKICLFALICGCLRLWSGLNSERMRCLPLSHLQHRCASLQLEDLTNSHMYVYTRPRAPPAVRHLVSRAHLFGAGKSVSYRDCCPATSATASAIGPTGETHSYAD